MAFFSDPGSSTPRVIGHRGACGLLPEHTLPSYQLAIDSGADAIELDVVSTRDGQLIARHDLELSATTNVAVLPRFASRRSERNVDGKIISGWFAEDFTLAEIKLLRARQRLAFRDLSHDGRYEIPTLAEVLDLARASDFGRTVAVYIELKHAAYHAKANLPLDHSLLATLHGRGLLSAESALCVEAFEAQILRTLRPLMEVRLVQLIESVDMTSPSQLAQVKTYADGIGVWKRLIVPTAATGADEGDESYLHLASPMSLVSDARSAGLWIEAWTFRDEARFLAAEYRGDPSAEYRQFYELGVHGVVTDFPATALAARR